MVEMDYSGLKSKKYCNPSHSSRIEVLCTQDGTLCCADCAADHSNHLHKVIDIKSIFEGRQTHYRQLKTRIKILSKMSSSPDEIRSYVAQLLESSFDQIIARVAEMKSQWIEENFSKMMYSLGVHLEQNIPDLTIISTELEEAFQKIHNFVNSEETNTEEIMKLKQPEEFEPQIEEILKVSNIHTKYKDIKVNLHFEEESIKKMIKIEGITLCSPKYENSIFSKEDLDYTISLLPPIKELRILFSGQKDGMIPRSFHSKCDGIEDTLVLFKSNNGHSFGGFAKPPWNSNTCYIRDDTYSSFLFTCRNKTKHTLTDPQHAMYGHKNYGPIFGGGHDLCISGSRCQNAVGTSYSIPGRHKALDYLCGLSVTELEDYQVYKVIFQ